MTKSATGLAPVKTGDVGGVVVYRHQLTVEASRLTSIARRLGIRINRWFRKSELDSPESLDLPPVEQYMPYMDWYLRAVAGMLKEQRMRASLAKDKGALPISDEEFGKALVHELLEVGKAQPELLAEFLDKMQRQSGEMVDAPSYQTMPNNGAVKPGPSVGRSGSSPPSDTDELFDFSEGKGK